MEIPAAGEVGGEAPKATVSGVGCWELRFLVLVESCYHMSPHEKSQVDLKHVSKAIGIFLFLVFP